MCSQGPPNAGAARGSAVQTGGAFLGAGLAHACITFRSPFHLAWLAAIRSVADTVTGDGLEDVVAEGRQVGCGGGQQQSAKLVEGLHGSGETQLPRCQVVFL